jgi:hypothetical protein
MAVWRWRRRSGLSLPHRRIAVCPPPLRSAPSRLSSSCLLTWRMTGCGRTYGSTVAGRGRGPSWASWRVCGGLAGGAGRAGRGRMAHRAARRCRTAIPAPGTRSRRTRGGARRGDAEAVGVPDRPLLPSRRSTAGRQPPRRRAGHQHADTVELASSHQRQPSSDCGRMCRRRRFGSMTSVSTAPPVWPSGRAGGSFVMSASQQGGCRVCGR